MPFDYFRFYVLKVWSTNSIRTSTIERPDIWPKKDFTTFTIGSMNLHGIHWAELSVVRYWDENSMFSRTSNSLNSFDLGTIYPGLMVTSAVLYHLSRLINITIDIRNICVFLAPLFSSFTTIVTYLLTKELKVSILSN